VKKTSGLLVDGLVELTVRLLITRLLSTIAVDLSDNKTMGCCIDALFCLSSDSEFRLFRPWTT